ncbi:DUF4489 domain-containing protein [Syntrophomonas curvata]
MSTYKMNCACPPPGNVNQTILACGSGTGVVLPDHSESNSQLFNPYVVASVAIDTRTLVRPTVKIDFSSLITFKEADYYPSDLRLTFQLIKVCENGARVALGTWNYERFIEVHGGLCVRNAEAAPSVNSGHFTRIETVDSFGFTFCECQDCPGCCHYVVEIINAETNNVDHPAVSNGAITALAVGPLAHWDD